MMRRTLINLGLASCLVLGGCVSRQTYNYKLHSESDIKIKRTDEGYRVKKETRTYHQFEDLSPYNSNN